MSSRKLKLYTDRSYIIEGAKHVSMLTPFWGDNPLNPEMPRSGELQHYNEKGKEFFELTSLEDADIAVAPSWWDLNPHNEELTRQLVDRARKAGKQTVIFFWSDSTADVPLDDIVLLRTSFYRSSRKPTEFALPAWSEDLIEKYRGGELSIQEKTERPIVGFCGVANLPNPLRDLNAAIRSQVRNLLGRPPLKLNTGRELRGEALQILLRRKDIQSNFIIRRQFYGGARSPDRGWDIKLAKQVRAEYLQNMLESQYIVCIRGAGNFSYRLYETLCCGRIPVFIDTDCVLPFDFALDWKQYCVWVDEKEIDSIAEKVLEFHRKISSQDFVDLQHACRSFWNEWLAPEGFFRHFDYHLQVQSQAQHV